MNLDVTKRRLRVALVLALGLSLPGGALTFVDGCSARSDPPPFPLADGDVVARSDGASLEEPRRGADGSVTLDGGARPDALIDEVCEPTWRTCPNAPPRTQAQIDENVRLCRANSALPCLADYIAYVACVKPYARCDDAGVLDLFPPNNPCPRGTKIDASVFCEADGLCRCN